MNSRLLEIQIKYVDQSIAYQEKQLAARKEYRERLQMELNRARRLEKELQDVTKS